MNIVKFLEELACTAHHPDKVANMIKTLPLDIQKMFLAKDITSLKNHINGQKILADRTTVFQL